MAAYTKEQRAVWARRWRSKPAVARHLSEYTRARQKAEPLKYAKVAYRSRCKRRGLVFRLPDELFDDFVTDRCYYCGADPQPINTIDRVDPKQGYLESNCVTACSPCNKAKNNNPAAAYIARCQAVSLRWSREGV